MNILTDNKKNKIGKSLQLPQITSTRITFQIKESIIKIDFNKIEEKIMLSNTTLANQDVKDKDRMEITLVVKHFM